MRNRHLSSLISHLSTLLCALSVVLCALLCLLAACSRSPRAELRRADAVIEADPDSAMALLRAIDRNTLTDSELPLYALLFTQAQVKQNVRLISDSLISIALDAYRYDAPDPSLRLRAHFYAAKVAYYSGDMPAAMRTAIVAYELSHRAASPYWTAKAAELIADIFSESYNESESAKYRIECIDKYLEAGKILNHRYALCDLAISYMNQGYYDQSICLLDSIRTVNQTDTAFDSLLDRYAISMLVPALVNAGNLQTADSLLTNVRVGLNTYEDSLATDIVKTYLAAADSNDNERSSALSDAYTLSKNDKDRLRVLYADYKSASLTRQYERAISLADTILYLENKVAEELLNESVASEQRDFYSNQAFIQRQKADHLTLTLCISAIASVIIIALLLIIFIRTARHKRAQLAGMVAELTRYRQESESNAKNLELLFKGHADTFNKLCSEYYNFQNSPDVHKKIKAQLDKELKKLQSPRYLKELESLIDKYRDGIMSKLRLECPFLSKEELRILTFALAGLSAKTIAFILKITDDTYDKRKGRICERIAESSAPDKDFILLKLKSHPTE